MKTSDLRGGLDTSVVVRLLTGKPESLSRLAYGFLDETQKRGQRLLVSDLVVAEAYFACQHHYTMPKDAVLKGLHQLLSEPIFAMNPDVLELLGRPGLASAKPGFVDRLIHADYAAQKATVIAFEKTASRLSDVEVLSTREDQE